MLFVPRPITTIMLDRFAWSVEVIVQNHIETEWTDTGDSHLENTPDSHHENNRDSHLWTKEKIVI